MLPFLQWAGGHIINTNCSAVHTRQALCCKMSVEYDKFIESGRKYVVAQGQGRLGPNLGQGLPRPHSLGPAWLQTSTRSQVVLPRG